MLDQIKLNNKTYNEIFQKALTTIPILSKEWTDYNYSDPGITTLQVLSIIKLFQQSYVDKIDDNVKCNLIKLLGYSIENVRQSIAHIKVKSDFDFRLYSGAKIKAGDIVFETCNNNNVIGGELTNIVFYDSKTDEYIEKTTLLLDKFDTVTYIFGIEPNVESAMYLVFNKPMEIDEEYNIYIEIGGNIARKYIPKEIDFKLSEIDWEILTDNGWHKIAVEDETKGFLQSGKILFYIDEKMIEKSLEGIGKGYIVRAVLKKCEYDLPPEIKNIAINVLVAEQKDTQAKSFIFDSNGESKQEYLIENYISLYNNVSVLVKDEAGRYKVCSYLEDDNPVCEVVNNFDGSIKIIFDEEKFQFLPPEGENVIKVICYSKYLFEKDMDTKIYGFENQIINLDVNDQIVFNEFNIMIKVRDYDDNEYIYDVESEDGGVPLIRYHLDSIKNEIKILDVNIAGDINLVITDFVLSKGKNGNVRESEINKFDQTLLKEFNKQNRSDIAEKKYIMNGMQFENLYMSEGGRDIETIDDVVLKIMDDMSRPHSLVTKKDFEAKVFEVPGISIHKVKAICNTGFNSVSIIVKPNSVDKFPMLTDVYKETIARYLDKYRLITTRIDILSPVYVPINVSGMIYIKPNYKDASKIIKDLIRRELDGITTDKDFGLEIVYGDLYSKIESLSCVDVIYYLSLDPDSTHAVKNMNNNIMLDKNALCYMGSYNIELNNNIMMVM